MRTSVVFETRKRARLCGTTSNPAASGAGILQFLHAADELPGFLDSPACLKASSDWRIRVEFCHAIGDVGIVSPQNCHAGDRLRQRGIPKSVSSIIGPFAATSRPVLATWRSLSFATTTGDRASDIVLRHAMALSSCSYSDGE